MEKHTFDKNNNSNNNNKPQITMTPFGSMIHQILEETHSVANLVEYFRDNEQFTHCEPADVNKYGYLYRIGLNEWETITGISIDTLSTRWNDTDTLPAVEDGRIWVDFNFEDDGNGNGYTEDEGPRYVFVSLANYNGEYNNDDCYMTK
jgi:hypothetical protein